MHSGQHVRDPHPGVCVDGIVESSNIYLYIEGLHGDGDAAADIIKHRFGPRKPWGENNEVRPKNVYVVRVSSQLSASYDARVWNFKIQIYVILNCLIRSRIIMQLKEKLLWI